MSDESWNRKPRRIGKVIFEEKEINKAHTTTHFDVYDNYGNKIGSGTGFTIQAAMIEIIEIAYELHAGEYEHMKGGTISRQSGVKSKDFNEKHGKLALKNR